MARHPISSSWPQPTAGPALYVRARGPGESSGVPAAGSAHDLAALPPLLAALRLDRQWVHAPGRSKTSAMRAAVGDGRKTPTASPRRRTPGPGEAQASRHPPATTHTSERSIPEHSASLWKGLSRPAFQVDVRTRD